MTIWVWVGAHNVDGNESIVFSELSELCKATAKHTLDCMSSNIIALNILWPQISDAFDLEEQEQKHVRSAMKLTNLEGETIYGQGHKLAKRVQFDIYTELLVSRDGFMSDR